MEKFKRNERIGAIIKVLADHPNQVITYNYFSELLTAAKSSISEDVAVVKKTIEELKMGKVETVSGAAGGVKYIPVLDNSDREQFIDEMCTMLQDQNRIISGGYLYYTDIIYSSEYVDRIGKIIAGDYIYKDIDYVVTMETKGIPIAMMTARYLNRPLVIVRRGNKVTDGATVSINYISGTSSTVRTISLPKRSLKDGSKVIIVDDFMKGGGTALGIINLLKEFNTIVEGISVLIASEAPQNKLIKDYEPLMILKNLNSNSEAIEIVPYKKGDTVL
ncbi:purine operon repressor PurR [Alkalibaculum bacchi]|uniref:Purine operon repressor PurR n=1 Tax=Alkalibaculum bacchi TaxID=645887 RepID=A0A366IDF1_9FIRM|nr:pur operon repressor [Alkalibaculum bacchi]RBP67449.1 purine operon repressor PurR [Alkalibaculum bacchi]